MFESENRPTKLKQARNVDKKIIPYFFSRTDPICILLHYDNASSHTANKTKWFLTSKKLELVTAHSPDFAPCIFLFSLKSRDSCVISLLPLKRSSDSFSQHVENISSDLWSLCFEKWFDRMRKRLKWRVPTLKNYKCIILITTCFIDKLCETFSAPSLRRYLSLCFPFNYWVPVVAVRQTYDMLHTILTT